jgi:putative FmdB family regulatory protein
MPIYEFECPNGTITAKLVKVGTRQIRCPKCHQNAKKILSPCTFELKSGRLNLRKFNLSVVDIETPCEPGSRP